MFCRVVIVERLFSIKAKRHSYTTVFFPKDIGIIKACAVFSREVTAVLASYLTPPIINHYLIFIRCIVVQPRE